MSAQSLGSRAILGRMYQRLESGATGWVDRLAFHVDSDQESETHKWLGMSPMMREWVGGRLVHGLRDFGQTIVNRPYEATIAVMLDEIRRDKTGQVMARVDGLADRTNDHAAKLLSSVILAADSTVCYDGQYFFDTDHSEGDSGTQDNDLAININAIGVPTAEQGTPTAPTAKVMAAVVLQCIQQMYGFKDDQGEPINQGATSFVAMCPVPLWGATLAGVAAANLAGGETNTLAVAMARKGITIDVVPNPRLTWTDKLAVFRADDGNGTKPFIKQEEESVRISAKAEGSDEEFDNDRHVYGTSWRGGVGLGFWQAGCLATLSQS